MPAWRVYFNRSSEQPTVWSIDEGTQATEVNVKAVRLHRCNADTHWDPSIKVNPDTPCAWLDIYHAIMQLSDGVAHFFPDPDWRVPRINSEK
jgi:hypothetical protein